MMQLHVKKYLLLQLHYFISLQTANSHKSEVFLLKISSGNVNASVVILKVIKKSPSEKLHFLCFLSLPHNMRGLIIGFYAITLLKK